MSTGSLYWLKCRRFKYTEMSVALHSTEKKCCELDRPTLVTKNSNSKPHTHPLQTLSCCCPCCWKTGSTKLSRPLNQPQPQATSEACLWNTHSKVFARTRCSANISLPSSSTWSQRHQTLIQPSIFFFFLTATTPVFLYLTLSSFLCQSLWQNQQPSAPPWSQPVAPAAVQR